MKSSIQAVLFDKKIFTSNKARYWLKKYRIIPSKRVHVTKSYLRYRITNPSLYQRFITKRLSNGVKIVFGWN